MVLFQRLYIYQKFFLSLIVLKPQNKKNLMIKKITENIQEKEEEKKLDLII